MIDALRWFFDLFMHLDKHLASIIETYGLWTYVLLFAIVFAETGLVVTPLLPGDSLLFAAGTFAGMGSLRFELVFVLLSVAAILGDTANYWIGKYLGQKLVGAGGSRWVKREYLERTHAFFEKYGGKTIIIARFVPIVRTFAPFVAGLGTMTYSRFILYNVVGGILWVAVCTGAGYFFGGLPFVRDHFSFVVLGIIAVSLLPVGLEFLQHRRRRATRSQPISSVESPSRNPKP